LSMVSFFATPVRQPDGIKVNGETRIPNGVYNIELRNAGGMTKRYAARFPGLHRGMLHLQDVPGFEWVYIHIGNDDDDTLGCILTGEMPGSASASQAVVRSSTTAYTRLYQRIIDAMDDGETVVIDVNEVHL